MFLNQWSCPQEQSYGYQRGLKLQHTNIFKSALIAWKSKDRVREMSAHTLDGTPIVHKVGK